MKSSSERYAGWPLIIGIVVGVLALTAGPALAALTFSGTSISSNGAVVIDSSSTISIGNPSSTISLSGNVGINTTSPGGGTELTGNGMNTTYLSDFRVVRTSSKTLTVCPECSSSLRGYWAFATQWNSGTGGFLGSPVTVTINAGAQPAMSVNIGLGDDNKVHFTNGGTGVLPITCSPAPNCVLDDQSTELAGQIPIAVWESDDNGVWFSAQDDFTAPIYMQGSGVLVTDNKPEGQHFNTGAGAYEGAILDIQPGIGNAWTFSTDGVTVTAKVDNKFWFVQSSDPGCSSATPTASLPAGDIGKEWFDTTTTTTAFKVCLNFAGTLTWVSK